MWFAEPHPFPKEDHLPDRGCGDNKVTKGDCVDNGDSAHTMTCLGMDDSGTYLWFLV